jgi:hypothetical protein
MTLASNIKTAKSSKNIDKLKCRVYEKLVKKFCCYAKGPDDYSVTQHKRINVEALVDDKVEASIKEYFEGVAEPYLKRSFNQILLFSVCATFVDGDNEPVPYVDGIYVSKSFESKLYRRLFEEHYMKYYIF